MIPLVDLGAQYAVIRDELQRAVDDVFQSGTFVLGPQAKAFETEFAAACGVPYAVGVGNGTDALTLALRALDVGPGHEVIVPASSFVATAEAVCLVGARPIFADVSPETLTLTPAAAAACVTQRTRAIIAVHLYGHPAEMDALEVLARQHGLALVEDAAQAHGARFRGMPVGSLGTAACFSFFPSKNLGAPGDAGIVVTNDSLLAQRVRRLANHGRGAGEKYTHAVVGTNSRLDEIHAACLRVKLGRLTGWNQRRRAIAQRYDARLRAHPALTLQVVSPQAEPVYHLYVIRTARRDELAKKLARRGIATGVHYPAPLHLLEAFAGLGYRRGDFPVSERAAAEVLSLPMYPEMTDRQVDEITNAISQILEDTIS